MLGATERTQTITPNRGTSNEQAVCYIEHATRLSLQEGILCCANSHESVFVFALSLSLGINRPIPHHPLPHTCVYYA